MDKKAFLEKLQRERANWEELLKGIDARRMEQPGAAGNWSVKDIIAHVTWHEKEMLGVLRTKALAGSEWWNLPTDQRNEKIYEQNRGRSLEDVLQESHKAYGDLLAAFEAASEVDFLEAGRYRDMPQDWIPWEIFAQNTYEHYQQHEPSLAAWNERKI